MDRKLLRQQVRQMISVIKTKHELKCQNELFCSIHSLETQSILFLLLRLFDEHLM